MRRPLRDAWQALRTRAGTVRDRWRVVVVTGVALALVVGTVTVGWRRVYSSLDLVAGVLAFLLLLKATEILVVFGSRLVR